MSMFTPIGAGGRPPGKRRRGRRTIAILLVFVLVAGAGAAAYWWYWGGGREANVVSTTPTPTPSAICSTPAVTLPEPLPGPADIKVEVLNGTKRNGLATQTANAMVQAGFDVVAWGNADGNLDDVAMVTYGKGDLPGAVVVASYVPGAGLKQVQRNTGGVVVVTIGGAFTTIATAAEAREAVDSVALPTPSPVCTPAGA